MTPARSLLSSSSLNGELHVAGDDARLLVVAGGVAGELEDLGREVLEDGGEVDRGAGAGARGVLALLQVAVDAAHRELQPSLGAARLLRARGATALLASRLATASHCCV